MSNEEIQRKIEFLIDQQAQYVARRGEDEARLTRLEDAFVTLVELARIADERSDRAEQRIDTFDEKMAVVLEAQARTDIKLAELAEAQAHTDERLNALMDVVDRYIRKGNNDNLLN